MMSKKKLIAVLFVVVMLITPMLATVRAQNNDPCQDSTPRIAVMSAFSSELALLLDEADIEGQCVLTGVTYSLGTLRGNDVVLFLSGVSMVNASMTTERALDYFNITHIVFSGIAGGVNPDLHIGDVVVPEKYGQYMENYLAREIDGTFYPPAWWTPEWPNYGMMFPSSVSVIDTTAPEADTYVEQFWFPANPEMYAVAQTIEVDLAQCTPENVCLTYDPTLVVGGNGVSGQSFVDNGEFRAYVWKTFGAYVLEMETAAVAQVAASHHVPYLAFRSLSDLAGGGEGENEINTFFQLASDNSARVLIAFLEKWATH